MAVDTLFGVIKIAPFSPLQHQVIKHLINVGCGYREGHLELRGVAMVATSAVAKMR